ncbi:hypothetical protein HOLleu_40905 [Holothuria leucospilota]|uniref:Uncharacterized protein n=1 Tax=Holothuria leucospilota TaxID=206669 RepID=A0A9Q1BC09_HOLLE|nr:hypothetical protein HOLleu_40905 [Holothuria leucospilota]
MKRSVRLTLNGFLCIFVLLLPSLSIAQPYYGDYGDYVYPWERAQLAVKRRFNPVPRSPVYTSRKSLGDMISKMVGRRLVDDSTYRGKRPSYPIRPGLVTWDALRGEQQRLSQDKLRNQLKMNEKFFIQHGRR